MQPEPFKGPMLPDLILALGGIPAGGLVGFWVGGVVQIFRQIKMSEFALYGSGILGTFCVFLVIWSRII